MGISALSGENRWHIEHGDSLVVLRGMADNSVDSVVTDPPAGICFMGKAFDHHRGGRTQWVAWLSAILAECYRVTKPGGRMLCWSIPRTMHWTGCAIEDAGWVIENCIAHINGSGFPKGRSQLKPSFEGWWLARKPAKNVAPLNIDSCRVSRADTPELGAPSWGGPMKRLSGAPGQQGKLVPRKPPSEGGRWPANFILSHSPGCDEACVEGCPVTELDRQSGRTQSTIGKPRASAKSGDGYGMRHTGAEYADSGGASRFFNTFKHDDPEGLECDLFIYQAKASKADRGDGNNHPTVKSVGLMRHLCRLITPPNGVVLDPFFGSGSTGKGALAEGFRIYGIEQEAEYVELALARLCLDAGPEKVKTPKEDKT